MKKTKKIFLLVLLVISIFIFSQAQFSTSAPNDNCCDAGDCGECENCLGPSCPTRYGSCRAKLTGSCNSCPSGICECVSGECKGVCTIDDDCGQCESCDGTHCQSRDANTCDTCSSGLCECRRGTCRDVQLGKAAFKVRNEDSGILDVPSINQFVCSGLVNITIDPNGDWQLMPIGGAEKCCTGNDIICGFKAGDDGGGSGREIDYIRCCKLEDINHGTVSLQGETWHDPNGDNTVFACPGNSVLRCGKQDGSDGMHEVYCAYVKINGVEVEKVSQESSWRVIDQDYEALMCPTKSGSGGPTGPSNDFPCGQCTEENLADPSWAFNCSVCCKCEGTDITSPSLPAGGGGGGGDDDNGGGGPRAAVIAVDNLITGQFIATDLDSCLDSIEPQACDEIYTIHSDICGCGSAPAPCHLRDENSCTQGTTDCAWCPQPGDTSVYPYRFPTFPGDDPDATEACVNTTWDPHNCGQCGFPEGSHVLQGGKGFCPMDQPYCVLGECKSKSEVSGDWSQVVIPDYFIDAGLFNPKIRYDVVSDGDGAYHTEYIDNEGNSHASMPVYILEEIDDQLAACQGAAGPNADFVEEPGLGCCGDKQCREKSGSVCNTGAICDGVQWHYGLDNNGEVFTTEYCGDIDNQFPIANMNGEFVRCVDHDRRYEFFRDYGRTGPPLCMPITEGNGIDSGIGGGMDYLCGYGKYSVGGFRAAGGNVCAGHGQNANEVERTDPKVYYACDERTSYSDANTAFAFAYIADTSGVSSIGNDEDRGDYKYHHCPATITSTWVTEDENPVSMPVILPCPGMLDISGTPISNEFQYEGKPGIDRTWGWSLGDDKGMRSMVICREPTGEELDRPWAYGLNTLQNYWGEGSVMGLVENNQYLCTTDETLDTGSDTPARAKIGVCCGSDGCGSISVGQGGETYNPGEAINASGRLYYCLDTGNWTYDLDPVEMQDECDQSFVATGQFCCAEGDDTSTWINESYNDPNSTVGACFKGVPQFNERPLFYNDTFYSNVFISNGSFYGCGFNDSMFVSEYNITVDPELLIPTTPTGDVIFSPTGNLISDMGSITGAALAPIEGNDLSLCVKECIVEMCAGTAIMQEQCQKNCPLSGYSGGACRYNIGVCDWDKTFNGANPRKDCSVWCGRVASELCSFPAHPDDPCNGGAHYVGWKCFPPREPDHPLACRRCTYPIMHSGDEGPLGPHSCDLFYDVIKGPLCDPGPDGNLTQDCLQNIEDWPNPGTGCNETRTALPLIKEVDYCTVIDTMAGGAYCSFGNTWNDTFGANLSHQSIVPEPLFDYFNETFLALGEDTSNFRDSGCCEADECWNTSTSNCIPEQMSAEEYYYVNETAVYKCVQGYWINVEAEGTRTPDGCFVGHCPAESQCLYDINGDPNQNGNVSRGARPQCINHLQYIGESLCINGEWITRTKILALKLASLVPEDEDFVLMCGPAEDVLINVDSQDIGFSTNFCVLNYSGQRIIGTTLNEPLINETSPGNDFLGALQASFLGVYAGMDVDFSHTCTSATDDFEQCIDLDDDREEPILRLYYDSNLSMVVFSNEDVDMGGGLGAGICALLPSWLKWLCPNPSVAEESLQSLTLFNKTYAAKKGNKEVFGVGERVCDRITIEQEWVFSFNYTGFSSTDLSDLVNHIDADYVLVTEPNKNIYIENPKHDAWLALTLLRNTGQE